MNNEEKILNMLEKIYTELQETKTELKEDIKKNTNAICKLETKIESEISDKIRGLYDTREIANSKLDSIDNKIDDMKIDINNISIKTLHNDNRLIKLVKDRK